MNDGTLYRLIVELRKRGYTDKEIVDILIRITDKKTKDE